MADKDSFDLSKYKLLDIIGRGAFFKVCKVIEEDTGSLKKSDMPAYKNKYEISSSRNKKGVHFVI